MTVKQSILHNSILSAHLTIQNELFKKNDDATFSVSLNICTTVAFNFTFNDHCKGISSVLLFTVH